MKDEKQTVTAAVPAKQGVKFTKAQLTEAKRFRERRDALNALLKDNETYTVDEAQKIIDDYMKGQVK